MTRIKSDNVTYGDSFVVPIEQSSHKKKIQEALEKEQEILLQAQAKAEEILAQTKNQAQQLIEDAKNQALSEVSQIHEQAQKEGFEAGRQEGLQNITEELQDKIIAVENFAKNQFDIKHNIVKSANEDIVKLVLEIAKKVCDKSFDSQDMMTLTTSAIQCLKDKESVTIIVNPKMAQLIYSISDELKEKFQQMQSLKIIEDMSVSPDGTIVESILSRVDSRISSQINELAEKMLAKLDSTPNSELTEEDD